MTAKELKFGILGTEIVGAHLLRAEIDTVLVGREELAHYLVDSNDKTR